MTNRLAVVVATLYWQGWSRCITSWAESAKGPYTRRVFSMMPLLEAYQRGFEESKEPVLGFVHDDVVMHEHGWDERVLDEFEDPKVGLVGFGGALGLGDIDIYKKPYQLSQLARHNFMSNMREAEVHGERFNGERDVAVLDGFALFVRRELLEKAGGWPQGVPVAYFMYDAWLSCEALRNGYHIRLVGVNCDHLGGKSTGMGQDGQFDFEAAHEWVYENYRDVLPSRVPR